MFVERGAGWTALLLYRRKKQREQERSAGIRIILVRFDDDKMYCMYSMYEYRRTIYTTHICDGSRLPWIIMTLLLVM